MLSFSRVFRLTENESRICNYCSLIACGRYERGSSKLEHLLVYVSEQLPTSQMKYSNENCRI